MGRRHPLDDLDQDIRDHIEQETLENIERGMPEAEARQAAVRKFGNVARVKEAAREVWVPGWLDGIAQDVRDAVRHLRRSPGVSFAIVVTLTLGIGLTTAIFSVVNAVLLRPLAYANPDRMVWLTTRDQRSGQEMMNSIDFAAWQSQVTSLEHMVAYDYVDSTIVAGVEALRLRIVMVSGGFWEVTGAQALLGVLPAGKDTQAVVLTHRTFREQFQGDPQAIGRAVTVDGRQATIAAVLPEDYQPQLPTRAWGAPLEPVEPAAYRLLTLQLPPAVITPTTAVRLYQAMGALKPGVTIEQARAEIDSIHTRSLQTRPQQFGTSTAAVSPLREKVVGSSRTALQLLLAAAICVLLITCANVANLLLSRSAARRKEIALRMSVGSGPLRVVRQLLAESLGYAILGGIGGVLLASWLVNAVVGVIGPAVPRLAETTVDVAVMAVAMTIAIGTAVLFGTGPAIALCLTNVQEVLKEAGRSVSASRRVLATGRAMVAVQVALTVVLLAGAGLMFKSVWRMTSYPEGFEPDRILTMRMDFRGPQFREPAPRRDFAAALLAKAQGLPGVRRAAITTGRESTMLVLREGQPMPENREAIAAPVSSISADFGRLLGMSLVAGRWFEEVEAATPVIINEALARRDFSDGDPLGQRIRMPWVRENGLATIVGVVSDLKYVEIDADAKPEVFFHHANAPLFGVTVALLLDGDPMAAAPAIRSALSEVDPTQSFYNIKTMEQGLSESIAPRRFNLLLLGTFAMVALILAVVGVYGVVAYAVAERTHEIGIRLALGSERAGIVRLIVRGGMASVLAGVGAGLVMALGGVRLLASLLYGVQPTDPPTFVAVTVAIAVVALVACVVPAMKGACVDPVMALRAE
jgi:putative ABC transport system permease protein